MKQSRFTEGQMIQILNEAQAGVKVVDHVENMAYQTLLLNEPNSR